MGKLNLNVNGSKVNLIFLKEASCHKGAFDLWHLQSVRSMLGSISEFELRMKCKFYAHLEDSARILFKQIKDNYDAVVSIQSIHPFNNELEVLLNQIRGISRTAELIKISEIKAGDTATTELDVYNSLRIKNDENFSDIKSCLIIDDVYASGKTLKSVVKRLQENGIPLEIEIDFGVLLKIV